MSVVNSILNLVDLNATKYNQKLKGVTKTTQAESKKTSAAFSAMSSAWTAAVGVISSAALGTAVVKELKATESAVASFIGATGGVTEARAMFEMLQQSARDTLQPFDALKAAALDLRRNGIEPNAEQLKTFSQIAISSGKSLESVTASFTAALQGRYKALNQLGITAKDMGDKIALTYKGQTQEIEKSTEAISGYFEKIGAQNSQALEYLQSGMSGALNQMDNAWGDFVRSIAESGLGQAIADTIRVGASALDGFTQWINDNKQPIKAFFNRWSDYIKKLGKDFQNLQNDMLSWFETSQKINGNEETTPGFFGWLDSLATTAGEKYFELFNGSEAERAYKYQKQQIIDVFARKMSQYKKGSEEYQKLIEQQNQAIVDLEKKYADEQTTGFGRVLKFLSPEDTGQKLIKNSEQYTKYLEEADRKRKELEEKLGGSAGPEDAGDSFKPFGTTTKGVKTQIKVLEDTWGAYYARVIQMQEDNASDREKIDADYFAKLAELQEESAKSTTATAEQVALAREIIEAEHQNRLAELQARAHEFYIQTIGDEEEQIRESYARKLEELQAFNEQQLLTEAQFLEARAALYEQYTADLTTLKKKQRGDADAFFTKEQREELQAFSDGTNTLSDAFSNLTATMSQSGAAYKTMFALQKAFAVASATTNAILAWSKALGESEGGWMQALANYATAVAMTTNILTQLKGVTMHDHGGNIPAGRVGIVGEFGPELVTGPANVTSRRETADLARQAISGTNVQVNLYEDASKAGTVEDREGADGDQIINIFVSNIRRGGQMAQTLENTYQLHRYGA